MMKKLVVIGFALTFLTSCMQKKKEPYAVDIITDENGNLSEIKVFRDNDDSNFIRMTFFRNGEIKRLTEYKKGTIDGKDFQWRKNGQLATENYMSRGVYDRMTREFHADGRIAFEGQMIDNVYEGVCNTFYKSGALKMRWTFVNGRKDGRLVEYYENGLIREIGEYFDDGQGYVVHKTSDPDGKNVE